MSAIASFFVVPHDRLEHIVGAATPRRGGWLRPAQDRFRDVLRAHSRELGGFGWSGWAFASLDLYLESRYGFMYEHFGDAEASGRLTKARGSCWLVLPPEAIEKLRAALDGLEPAADDVIEFVASEHGPAEAASEAEAVLAALTMLKSWLAQVQPGSVALLCIG
jgi:hypothetical protein